MERFGQMTQWAAWAVAAFAMTALAQPEQWLQYHTSREGRGYHWLDLTTNPPSNVPVTNAGATLVF